MFRSLVLITLCALAATVRAQSACSHYALVSGYFSNVHILDACSGAYLRDLDAQSNRLRGPQAIKLGPDGALWVVSERNAQINRYSAEDFTYLSAPIGVGTGFGVTGFDFRGQEVYVGGYDADSVRRYSLTGQLLGTAVPANAGVGGPDNGLAFGPDGLLYVPGFDTHNVLRHNPATGQNTVLVPGGSGGLRNTRGILFRPDGETFLVSSEGSGQVLEYRRDNGALVRELVRGLVGPTGLAWAPDGSLAVLDQGGVQLRDPGTGELRRSLIGAGSGLSGPTYVAFVRNPAATAPPSPSQIGTQFWISGAGRLDGRRLVVDAMQSTTGPKFGADFNPAEVVNARWGSLTVDFQSCSTATMQWNSSGNDSANFGTGGYALTRLLPSPGVQRCNSVGFAQSPPEDWLNGIWSGGAARSGEGFVFEFVNQATVGAAWFTHRPAPTPTAMQD